MSNNFSLLFNKQLRFFAMVLACFVVCTGGYQNAFSFPTPNPMAPVPAGGMSGTYEIGSSGGFNNPDFSTIKEAIDSLYSKGMAGNIRFELYSETFNERVVIDADSIPNYDSTKYIRFTTFFAIQPEGQDIGEGHGPFSPPNPASGFSPAVISYDAAGSTDNGTFLARGIYNLEVRNLQIKALDASYMQVIRLEGEADGVEIEYNVLESKYVNGNSFEQAVIINGANDDYNNCSISNNLILNGAYGIYWYGTSSSDRESNNVFENNTIKGWNRTGINVYYQDSVKINGNRIRDNGITTFAYSMDLSYVQENTEIKENNIVNSAGGASYGIRLQYLKGTSGNNINVINNSISMLYSGISSSYGLYIRYMRHTNVLHNTVLVSGNSATQTRAFVYNGTGSYTNNTIKNNVFANKTNGYACFVDAFGVTANNLTDMNNNCWYTKGTNLASWNNVNFSSLALWKIVSLKDANSVSVDPHFEADSTLKPQALFMNNIGSSGLASDDIDGNSRDASAPDPGAYEYTPPIPSPDYGDSTGSGMALDFDGVNDSVSCASSSSLNFTSAFTLEAWVNPSSFKTNVWDGTIIEKTPADFTGYMLRTGDNGKVDFYIGTGGVWKGVTTASNALTLNTWQHLAASYNGSTLKIYVNGVLVKSGAATGVVGSNTASLVIGNSAAYPTRSFSGKIDEVRIWNSVQSETEIRDWMCKKITSSHTSISNLKAYYRFDQSPGTTLYDLTKNGNNGTLNNMTNADWVISGASLGDETSYEYSSTPNPTITAGGSSYVSAVGTSGFGSNEGIQLYTVSGLPNNVLKPAGIDSILQTNQYFGVHKIADTSDEYKFIIDYSGLSLTKDQRNRLVVLKRENDQDQTWEVVSGRINNKTSSRTITINGQTGTQYVLGFSNTTYPSRPGAGYALDFDGNGDKIQVGSAGTFQSLQDFTIDFWFKVKGFDDQYVFGTGAIGESLATNVNTSARIIDSA